MNNCCNELMPPELDSSALLDTCKFIYIYIPPLGDGKALAFIFVADGNASAFVQKFWYLWRGSTLPQGSAPCLTVCPPSRILQVLEDIDSPVGSAQLRYLDRKVIKDAE